MSSLLLIDVGVGEIRAAHLLDNRLNALEVFHEETPGILGNIYNARVTKIVGGNDIFLDLGDGQSAHMSKRRAKADGRSALPNEGALIRVQIIREADNDKAAEATTRLRIAGRYVVFDQRVPGGFITRREHRAADAEKQLLKEKFENLSDKHGLAYKAPKGLEKILMNCPEVEAIQISDPALFAQTKDLSKRWPDVQSLLERHFETPSLFSAHDIDEEIEALLSGHIPLGSGAWLDMAQTRALCAIDINAGAQMDFGETSLIDVNIKAAKEIARQLRLQNIGGLIVIDFIDMQQKGAWDKVLTAFDQECESDKAKITRTNPSQFGLVEVNREKSGPSLVERFCERSTQHTSLAYQGHALLREANTLGKSAQNGVLRLEAPQRLLNWFEGHADLLSQLSNETKRQVEMKAGLAPRAMLVGKKADD
jgi:ribonuclease G